MENDTLMFAQVMTVIVLSVAGFVVIGLGARILWRLGSRVPRERSAPDDARLQRLETTVEAIAIEIERISEGQRFTVNLLSERLPERATERLGAPQARQPMQRMDTPH